MGNGDDRDVQSGHGEPGSVGGQTDDTSASTSASTDASASTSASTDASAKRGRGRPAKHATAKSGSAKAGAGAGAVPVGLRVDAAKKAPAPKPKPDQAAAAPLSLADAKSAVSGLVDLVNMLTVARLGPDAVMSPIERGMIEAPAARIMQRMTPAAAQRVSALSDPLLLGVGLLMWGTRLRGIGHQAAQDGSDAARAAMGPTPANTAATSAPGVTTVTPEPAIPRDSETYYGRNGTAPAPAVVAAHLGSDLAGEWQ